MTKQQPEALRLADCLDGNANAPWTREQVADELRRLHALLVEQQATISTLMCGMPEDGTTPVIRRIAALEAERDALRADADGRLAALRTAVLALAYASEKMPQVHSAYLVVSAAIEKARGAA